MSSFDHKQPRHKPWRRITALLTSQVLAVAVGLAPIGRWWSIGGAEIRSVAQVTKARVRYPISVTPASLPAPHQAHSDLPALDTHIFTPGDVLATGTISHNGKLERLEADRRLPYPYIAGLADAVADPVVKDAIQAGAIRKIVVIKANSHDDNGEFVPADNPFVALRIAGDGPNSTTYQRAISIRVALVHEALHALNFVWFGDGAHPTMDGGPHLGQQIRALQSACGALFEAPVIAYIQRHRVPLANEFDKAARGLLQGITKGNPVDDTSSRRAYAALKATSKALRMNDKDLNEAVPMFACNPYSGPLSASQPIEDFLSGTNHLDPHSSAAVVFGTALLDWAPDVVNTDDTLRDPIVAPLQCYEDQIALRALTKSQTVAAGEADANATEAVSSVTTVSIFAPQAARQCTVSLSPDTRRLLDNYVDAILSLETAMSPELGRAISMDARSVSSS